MARKWYFDASALAKRYAAENGTSLLNHLFRTAAREDLMCLTLGVLEVISIFVRKLNAGALAVSAFHQVLADFKSEVVDATEFGKVSATDAVVFSAAGLIQRHSLNATDAVVLRSALDLVYPMRAVGDDLVLVASDQRLLRAAQVEGLQTFNPETQSQSDLDSLLAP